MKKPPKPMKPTRFLILVLSVIKNTYENNTHSSPHWIARAVFPHDHPIWQRRTKCGPNGTSKGGGANLFMGGYLGKVCRSGLVSVYYRGDDRRFCLTIEGRKMLLDNIHLLEDKDDAASA